MSHKKFSKILVACLACHVVTGCFAPKYSEVTSLVDTGGHPSTTNLHTGGAATGGSRATGGAATGGGVATGGTLATGGAATGGGVATGGVPATAATGGAHTTGGAATGGAATGGSRATGGAATGGGVTTGGTLTTGGAATGGAATGGAATGGASSAGGGSSSTTCTDPTYPVSCPALGATIATCWTQGTQCSTVATCSGAAYSCFSTDRYYDCSTGLCLQCTNSSSSVGCPAIAGFPASCWSTGTICSSITNCSGVGHSCFNSNDYFDCATAQCLHCSDPYPVACPAVGSVSAGCWLAGTVCSTITNCSGVGHACLDPNQYYDCTSASCKP